MLYINMDTGATFTVNGQVWLFSYEKDLFHFTFFEKDFPRAYWTKEDSVLKNLKWMRKYAFYFHKENDIVKWSAAFWPFEVSQGKDC